MSVTSQRVAVVFSNAENICNLLNVADEQHFLQSCMTSEVFQKCIAGDTNRTRVLNLCGKMIDEIWAGSTIMYDALSEYFLKRSEAYMCMYQRFAAIGSNCSGNTSTAAESQLLHLQENVKELTQELLHWRQQESVDGTEVNTASNVNVVSHNTTEVKKLKHEATDEWPDVQPTEAAIYQSDLVSFDTKLQEELELEATEAHLLPCQNDENPCLKTEPVSLDSGTNLGEAVQDEPAGQITMRTDFIEHDIGLQDSVTVRKTVYSCVHCGKTFRWKSHLLQHVRIHTGEKPFACEHCGMMFTHKFNLAQHVRIHSGEKSFLCHLCGMTFAHKFCLVQHVRIHTGEKPFVCEHCGRMFAQRHTLVEHVRIHTEEKPYVCEDCGKRFVQKSHLTRHIRIHTGEKPFACEHCDKMFTRKSNLLQHVRTHTGER